jgi:uncharacterized transporter YbjL
MKKIMVFVAVLVMVAFAFGALAAEQKAAPKKMAGKFSGQITKTNAMAKTFDVSKMVTVKGKKEEQVMVFSTDDGTKVIKGKEVKTLVDLKAGMNVAVDYWYLADVEPYHYWATMVKIAVPKSAPKK